VVAVVVVVVVVVVVNSHVLCYDNTPFHAVIVVQRRSPPAQLVSEFTCLMKYLSGRGGAFIASGRSGIHDTSANAAALNRCADAAPRHITGVAGSTYAPVTMFGNQINSLTNLALRTSLLLLFSSFSFARPVISNDNKFAT